MQYSFVRAEATPLAVGGRAYLRAHERITHCEYPDETNGDLLSGAHPLLFLLDQVVVVVIIEVDDLHQIWSL